MTNYEAEKMFWRKYTNDNLTNDDIDEINHNLMEFAKVFIDFQQELQEKSRRSGKEKGE